MFLFVIFLLNSLFVNCAIQSSVGRDLNHDQERRLIFANHSFENAEQWRAAIITSKERDNRYDCFVNSGLFLWIVGGVLEHGNQNDSIKNFGCCIKQVGCLSCIVAQIYCRLRPSSSREIFNAVREALDSQNANNDLMHQTTLKILMEFHKDSVFRSKEYKKTDLCAYINRRIQKIDFLDQ